jgi:hypothetical protein
MAGDPLDSSPTDWARPPVSLVPVDHDPFNDASISLVPIDHDPFNDSWAHDPFNNSWATGTPVDTSWMRPFSAFGGSIAPQGGFGDPSVVPSKAATPPSAADGSDVTGSAGSVFAEPENKAANERTWQKIQGIGNVLGGAFNVAFSPVGMVSVPLERAGGTFPNGEPQIPKEVTEFGLGLVGPSILGGAAKLTRLNKGIKPTIRKPPIGGLPKTMDIGNLDTNSRAPSIGDPEPGPPIGPLQPSPAQAPSSSIPLQTSLPASASAPPAPTGAGASGTWRDLPWPRSTPAIAETLARDQLSAAEQLAARRRAQLQVNKATGSGFEADTAADLHESNHEFAPQITVQTPSGARTRLDFMARDPQTNEILCIECKGSETAPTPTRQRRAHQAIQQEGATIMGKGKPRFSWWNEDRSNKRADPASSEVIE